MLLTKILKSALGLFYLIGGPLIHGYLMMYQRSRYAAVEDQAWSVYQSLWSQVVLSHLPPLVIGLVLLEMLAGGLMLSQSGRWAALGQLGGLIFNLLLMPFWFFYSIPNLLLVFLHGWLLLQECQVAVPSSLQPIRAGH